jgi:hypothetical protein
MVPEELEIATEVEDVKVGLVLSGPEQIRAKAGAPPDHLGELRARMHRLEEHQIDDLGDVDPSVQHVHGDGDVWR